MKTSENKPHSIHLRLTDEQYEFLAGDAEIIGVSVTDYVRMVINTTMYASKKIADNMSYKLGDLKKNADNQSNIECEL